MQRWEYKVLIRAVNRKGALEWLHDPKDQRSAEEMLSGFGSEGWELVSALTISMYENSSWSGQTSQVDYMLKRPVG